MYWSYLTGSNYKIFSGNALKEAQRKIAPKEIVKLVWTFTETKTCN